MSDSSNIGINRYFRIWENIKFANFGNNHLNVVSEIVYNLSNFGNYGRLQNFISEIQPNVNFFLENEKFLKGLIDLRFHQHAFTEVYRLITKQSIQDRAYFLDIWDNAHYREKQIQSGRQLTPLMRFRIRQAYPPPDNICPEGSRPTNKLSQHAKRVLNAWLQSNLQNPYPSREEKEKLAKEARLTMTQIKNWFANSRRRFRSVRAITQFSRAKPESSQSSTLPVCSIIPKEKHENNSTVQRHETNFLTSKYMEEMSFQENQNSEYTFSNLPCNRLMAAYKSRENSPMSCTDLQPVRTITYQRNQNPSNTISVSSSSSPSGTSNLTQVDTSVREAAEVLLDLSSEKYYYICPIEAPVEPTNQ